MSFLKKCFPFGILCLLYFKIFGYPNQELIQLNEAKLWKGGQVKLNPTAYKYLPQVRAALFANNVHKAVYLL